MGVFPRALLLDLDGTLVDSFAAIATALDGSLAELGRPPLGIAWARAHVGRGLAALIADVPAVAEGAVPRADFVRRFTGQYERLLLAHTPPLPLVDRALGWLAQRVPLAVVSNKPERWTRRLVRHLGWGPLLQAVYGPESAGATKPQPAMLELALANLGVAAEEALLVGDMAVDVATGAAAGVAVLGLHRDPEVRAALVAAGARAVLPGLAALPGWSAAHWPAPRSLDYNRLHQEVP